MKHFLVMNFRLVVLAGITGCTSFQTVNVDGNSVQETLNRGVEVRITTKDGRIRHMTVVEFTSEDLIGELVRSNNIKDQYHQTIALGDISSVEVRQLDVWKSVAVGFTTVALVSLIADTMLVFEILGEF